MFLLLLDDAAPGEEAMAPELVPSRAPAPPLTPPGTAPVEMAPAVTELPTPPPERTEEGGMTMPALAVVVAMDVVPRATPISTRLSVDADSDAVSFEAEDSIESIIERNLSSPLQERGLNAPLPLFPTAPVPRCW